VAPVRPVVLAGALAGALLLLVAEFTALLSVHAASSAHTVETVTTGSHQSYALLPIAAVVIALAVAFWREGSRVALGAIAALGALVLVIAVLGDLPDAEASGLIRTGTAHYATASATPGIGLYLETLAAVVLMISGVAGLLLMPHSRRMSGS
jgi:hypothetical protein